MLQIYNTLTKTKQIFKPLVPGKVGIYVCGMTVYDYCHLGHARTCVAFDVVVRYLRACGYEVNYVRNITDVDDKIIARAEQNQEPISHLTERFIDALQQDTQALSILAPNEQPRATQHIDQMLTLIQRLLDKGYAYIAENGDIYYAVHRFPHYGCLAHQDLDKLRSGARIAVSHAKQDPLDFVLWKLAKPGEPAWESPWGMGRPGWHIECSAMAMCYLGEQFDIHGGGFDLTFPHHENEIAQSEAATGKTFAHTWMHVGFLQIDKEKMSKSLGNFLTISEVLTNWPAEVVRYFLLSSHYRGPLNYSDDALANAQAALTRLYTALREVQPSEQQPKDNVYQQRFYAAMDDDFNTPEALAVLFELARDINRLRDEDPVAAGQHASLLRALAAILGLLTQEPEVFLQLGKTAEAAVIEQLIAQRETARQQKDWAEADRLRQQLLVKGIMLEDSATGTRWRVV